MKKVTGTKEWACKTVNIQYGCENNCRYCYARKMAIRFNRVPALGWDHPILKTERPPLPRNTTIMMPSTHDITPNNMVLFGQAVNILLGRGNRILIVSKPRVECIRYLCQMNYFLNNRDKIEFRFTIGARDNTILRYWEPNASLFEERRACVDYALEHGFTVSISCEPLLDNLEPTDDPTCGIKLIDLLLQHDIKEIWIGAMNYMHDAPKLDYQAIYRMYKDNPRIKWKDSFLKPLVKSWLKLPPAITQSQYDEGLRGLQAYPEIQAKFIRDWQHKIK